ncbi:M3 family metallopeptidase [Rhodohalobacter barkolensis]|uniref:Dipeptidyl carboxypeptidase II n=1 Tax=Rhodohalobacter barkolensis TaxID=2053187 RepID=A0A2N0VK50_9BACT|nr:M3 family metallopeptidase [Rhodohalobacter barkolensis]PKD44558.1 dipeptidyl carboxypeptidase II [Rhodohalobacter barkolensis]
MKITAIAIICISFLLVLGCSNDKSMTENPFYSESSLPFEAPDFDNIENRHFMPAFERGMKEGLEQIEAIANQDIPPTFDNTIVAMEQSGDLLTRVQQVFYNLTSAHTNDEIQDIQSELAPKLAAHSDNIYLNRNLFERVETLYNDIESLSLSDEAEKLLSDIYRDFVRAGAQLSDSEQQRMREINERMSSLTTEFQEKLLAMTRERAVVVDDIDMLEGLSNDRIAAAKEAAEQRDHDDSYLINISNTTRHPLLSSLSNREMRKQIWEASAYRGLGENGGIDTRPILLEIAELRAERVQLLGYETYAHYAIEPQTGETPERVLELLKDLIPPVVTNSEVEAELIREYMQQDGIEDDLQPWDWEYYAEKVRQERYDINDNEVRAYFELNRVLDDGVFFAMEKLFGITFEERFDLPVYHEDVRVWNVMDEDGSQIGLFYGDFFSRDSKRGGAWMNSFVVQSHLKEKNPVVVNVLNITPPAEGEPALVSFDNVTTLFHEMGHAVHGLFSDVTYPSLAGTSVPRDFVEFPSTFQEDWAILPEVLENYAKHHETGERIPQDLLDKLIEAREFNQGFNTYEYLAATLVDMEWHLLDQSSIPSDVEAFEQASLAKYNLANPAIPPRYKSTYFSHIFSGGYAANYYAYIWSEILAADAFAFMSNQGGLTRDNGNRFREYILSQGGSEEAMDLYRNYRGGEPDVQHLLERRGLTSN